MMPVKTPDDLRMRILLLESQCLQQEEELKMLSTAAMDSLKPINILKSTISNAVKSPGVGTSLLKGAFGLAVGFLSKKIFVKSGAGIVKKGLGAIVELGVAKVVANNADKITVAGIKLLQKAIKK